MLEFTLLLQPVQSFDIGELSLRHSGRTYDNIPLDLFAKSSSGEPKNIPYHKAPSSMKSSAQGEKEGNRDVGATAGRYFLVRIDRRRLSNHHLSAQREVNPVKG